MHTSVQMTAIQKRTAPNDMVGPFFEIGPDAFGYVNASGQVKYQYDTVTADVATLLNWNCNVKTHLFAGVEGTRIGQKYNTFYSNADGTVSRSIDTPSSFCGAGPRLGADFSYEIFEGLSFNGEGVVSLLVGNLKNHTTYRSNSPFLAGLGITPPNTQTTHVNDRTGIVPAFKCKLGLDYAFSVADYAFDIDVGYEVRLYLNAIQSVDMGSEVVTPPIAPDEIGVFARTFQRNISNFGLSGPYLRITLRF